MNTNALDRTADVALMWWYVEQNTHKPSLHANKLTVLYTEYAASTWNRACCLEREQKHRWLKQGRGSLATNRQAETAKEIIMLFRFPPAHT